MEINEIKQRLVLAEILKHYGLNLIRACGCIAHSIGTRRRVCSSIIKPMRSTAFQRTRCHSNERSRALPLEADIYSYEYIQTDHLSNSRVGFDISTMLHG